MQGWLRVIEVNEHQCFKLAEMIKEIRIGYEKTLTKPLLESQENALRLFFYYMAINYDTRGISGYVNGRYYRGSEYLYHVMRRQIEANPQAFNADAMVSLTLESFKNWFGGPEFCEVRRPEERITLLRNAAEVLLRRYEGNVSNLLEESQGFIEGERGLKRRLSEIKAFDDPLAKKTMVLLLFLHYEGLFRIRDPENVTVGIDYHLQRIALRSGIVEVVDDRLERKLKLRRFVSNEAHHKIRKVCLGAYMLIGQRLKWCMIDVDQLFWQIGRNCCLYTHPPFCGERVCENKFCTLVENSNYQCGGGGKCPLDGACKASLDNRYVRFFEPKVITYYY